MYEKKLLALGVPGNLVGFAYLDYALQIYVPRQSICRLYEDVAKHFSTKDGPVTADQVEQGIRRARLKAGQKMTNGAFIAKYKIEWQ